MGNISRAFKAFFTVLSGKEYTPALPENTEMPESTDETLKMSTDRRPDSVKEAFNHGAIYTLNLLQREGRLIDFLQEEIAAYEDAQIGAAVRQIHTQSRKVLSDVFALKPVINSTEGQDVVVQENYDPSEITLVGEFPNSGPYSGTLQHKGWIADSVDIPARTGKINPDIICPAEVSF